MTQTEQGWKRLPVARARQAYVACFLVGLTLLLADPSPRTGVVVSLSCALLTGLAVRFGPRLNTLAVLPGWQRDWAVCVAFLAVPAFRHLGDVAGAPVTVVADALVVAGYLMLLSQMVVLLRRRGTHDADMALDAVVVAVGAALVSLSFLVVPTLRDGHLPWWAVPRVLVVPVLDVTVLALLV